MRDKLDEEITTSTIKIPTQSWSDFEIIIQRKNRSLVPGKKLNKSLVITRWIRQYVEENKDQLDRPKVR